MSSFLLAYFASVYGVLSFELLLEILNFRDAKLNRVALPESLKNVFTPESIAKSVSYSRERERLKVISSIVRIAALSLGLFWFFPTLERAVQTFTGNFVWQGTIFFSILALGSYLLALPFSLYSTFSLEKKYGFNRTNSTTFVLDAFKGLMLSLIIGLPLLGLTLFMIDTVTLWWVYLLAGLVIFQLLSQWLFPVVILPLFFKLRPLVDTELTESLKTLCAKAGFKVKSVFVVDASRRTVHTNAFFTGIGKSKRIVLYDSLLEKHSREEIEAIFAHEAGHYANKHILKGMLFSHVLTGVAIFLVWLLLETGLVQSAFSLEREYTGLLYAGLFVSSLFSVLGWLETYISRGWEFQADRYSARLLGDARPMIEALKRLAISNLANLNPNHLYAALNYSHPAIWKRIEKLNEMNFNTSEFT